MKEDDILRSVAIDLISLGLDKVEVPYSVPIFAKTKGNVWRYFQPQAVLRQEGFQVLGSIGIRMPEFEAWWETIFAEVYTSRQVSNDCLFALFITNIQSLSSPPIFLRYNVTNREPLIWLRSIVNIVEQLPNSVERLKKSIEGGLLVGGFNLESFYCHPVKVYAFRRWCERSLPEVARSLRITEPLARTHPYEGIFELIRARQ
jgi:hypothetical protein